MIEVKSLSYLYHPKTPFQTPALNEISFNINPGEIVGLIGPGGSGKSCLLRCLAGILTPTAGEVLIDNRPPQPENVGLIIQEPEVQFFNETVYREIAFALEYRGLNRKLIDRTVSDLLAKFNCLDKIGESPFRLSGGEQRRVAIAGILALNPEILLMDEPTVGLDVKGLELISRIIEEYRSEGKTLVIVSHDLDFLYPRVERYLVLNRGRLIADFAKSDYHHYLELLQEIGLGLPELAELKRRELPVEILQSLMDLGL